MTFRRKKLAIILISTFVSAVLLFCLFFQYFKFFQVIGNSMSPALKDGEIYILQKGASDLERQDIIAFYSPEDDLNYVKRIVGLPGETIEIKDSQVYINGQRLEENSSVQKGYIPDFIAYKIPSDHVFVLGDNRTDSRDSRHIGSIPLDFIKGKITGY